MTYEMTDVAIAFIMLLGGIIGIHLYIVLAPTKPGRITKIRWDECFFYREETQSLYRVDVHNGRILETLDLSEQLEGGLIG